MKLFHRRRREATRAVIAVSGLPRSGTSMMMGMLEAGGIPKISSGKVRRSECKELYRAGRLRSLEVWESA